MIRIDEFDVCFLKETKMKVVDNNLVFSLVGNKEMERFYRDANGRSVGLLIMWKKGLFDLFLSFFG